MEFVHFTVEKDEAGYYVAEVPAMPGCVSQGRTKKEAKENIGEAIQGWLEVMEAKSKVPRRLLETVSV
jgi:predicted RNase H-like HicB family nuclease